MRRFVNWTRHAPRACRRELSGYRLNLGAYFQSQVRGIGPLVGGRRRIGPVYIKLRRLAGSSIHRARKHWDSVACRGGIDCGCVFRRPTWPRHLAFDHCRHHCSNLGRDCRLLDRQEVRAPAVEEIWDPSWTDGRTDKNRSMAIRPIRRRIRFHRSLFAISPQHGRRTCWNEFHGAAQLLFRQRDGGRCLDNVLWSRSLFFW